MRGRSEAKSEQEQRRESKQNSEECHPEVSNEALPEERNRLFLVGVEIEEEGAEGEVEKEAEVDETETERTGSEERTHRT